MTPGRLKRRKMAHRTAPRWVRLRWGKLEIRLDEWKLEIWPDEWTHGGGRHA